MKSRDQVMNLLAKTYPGMFLRTTEEFNRAEGGIWTSGEDHIPAKDGHSLFNYYSENHTKYSLGVHTEIYNLLEKHGWWAEWHDAGTIMIWPE